MGLNWRHAEGRHSASRDAGAASPAPHRPPPTLGARTHRRLLATTAAATTVAAFAILAVGVGSGAQTTAKPSAGTLLLRTAVHDALAHSSVHQVETEKSPTASGTVVTDAGTKQGRQVITHSQGENAQVIVVGGTAYFAGNQAALIHYFGLPAALAQKVGSRWVSVPSSSRGYSVVAAGLTLTGLIGGFAIPGQLTETAPTMVDGQAVVGIKSQAPPTGSTAASVSAIVYVTRSRTPLPVRAVYTFSKGGSATLDLSGWNEHLAVKAPTNVIPAAKL